MLGDYTQEFKRKLVDFIVFGLLGIVEYFLVAFVVGLATSMFGYAVAPDFVALSAALIVGATILTGGMPTDN